MFFEDDLTNLFVASSDVDVFDFCDYKIKMSEHTAENTEIQSELQGK
jgi:hypothetical protein